MRTLVFTLDANIIHAGKFVHFFNKASASATNLSFGSKGSSTTSWSTPMTPERCGEKRHEDSVMHTSEDQRRHTEKCSRVTVAGRGPRYLSDCISSKADRTPAASAT